MTPSPFPTPQQQYGRIGRCDLSGLLEDLPPLWGFANHATVAGARVELVGQRPDAGLQLRRTLGGIVGAPRRFVLAIARQRNGDAIGDAPRDENVGLRECPELLAEKGEHPGQLPVEFDRDAQRGAEAEARDQAIVRFVTLGHVGTQVVLPIRPEHVLGQLQAFRQLGHTDAGRRVSSQVLAIRQEDRKAERVMGHHLARDDRDAFEDVSKIPRAGQRPEQIVEQLEVGRARPELGVVPRLFGELLGEPMVRQRQGDVIREPSADGQIGGGEFPDFERMHAQATNHSALETKRQA
jgi:hypothetical protein